MRGGGRIWWCCSWLLYWSSIFHSVHNVILPSFSWDPRNLCFSGSTDGARLSVDQESQLYILCPSVAIVERVENSITDLKSLYENMFLCTKDEFDRCELDEERGDGRTRLVMSCDNPLDTAKLTYQSFGFQQFQSGEHGYAFEVNQTYYFIATSNGTKESLNSRKGGRCRNNNMKLAITICAQGEQCHQRNKPCVDPTDEPAANDELMFSAAVSQLQMQPLVETTGPPIVVTTAATTTDTTVNTTATVSMNRSQTTPCPTQSPTFGHPSVVAAPQVSKPPPHHGKTSTRISSKVMVLVGVGAFVGGIFFSLLSIIVYNKSCNGGPSCYYKSRKSVTISTITNGATQQLMA